MTQERKTEKPERIENLELNRETVQDLAEEQAEQAEGGLLARETGRTTCFPCTGPLC